MKLIRLAARMAALPCQAILALDDRLNPKPQRPERLPVASITWLEGRTELRPYRFGACNLSVKRDFLLEHGLFREESGRAAQR